MRLLSSCFLLILYYPEGNAMSLLSKFYIRSLKQHNHSTSRASACVKLLVTNISDKKYIKGSNARLKLGPFKTMSRPYLSLQEDSPALAYGGVDSLIVGRDATCDCVVLAATG
jgi:hypothetical protein